MKGNEEVLSLFSSDGDLKQTVEQVGGEAEVLQAAGAVGEGAGGGLEQAVRGEEAAADEPADVSIRERAVLDGYRQEDGRRSTECRQREWRYRCCIPCCTAIPLI